MRKFLWVYRIFFNFSFQRNIFRKILTNIMKEFYYDWEHIFSNLFELITIIKIIMKLKKIILDEKYCLSYNFFYNP